MRNDGDRLLRRKEVERRCQNQLLQRLQMDACRPIPRGRSASAPAPCGGPSVKLSAGLPAARARRENGPRQAHRGEGFIKALILAGSFSWA